MQPPSSPTHTPNPVLKALVLGALGLSVLVVVMANVIGDRSTSSHAESVADTTTAPAKALPAHFSQRTLAWLDCASLTQQETWWACQRGAGVAYLRATGSSPRVYSEIAERSDYNYNAFLLMRTTDGGYLYFPGMAGFDDILAKVGPRPDLELVTERDAGVAHFIDNHPEVTADPHYFDPAQLEGPTATDSENGILIKTSGTQALIYERTNGTQSAVASVTLELPVVHGTPIKSDYWVDNSHRSFLIQLAGADAVMGSVVYFSPVNQRWMLAKFQTDYGPQTFLPNLGTDAEGLVSSENDCSPDCADGHNRFIRWTFQQSADAFLQVDRS